MKKVGIVSCYFKNNYGSMLQAYATQKFLDNNNIPNETINIKKLTDFSKGKKKYYCSQVTNFNFIKTKFGMMKLKIYSKTNPKLKNNFFIRKKVFEEFKHNFNLSKQFTTYQELHDYSENAYSDVIVGSDQLWLPVNVVADYYTLNWTPQNVNKISYATSFGISSIPNRYVKKYNYFLNRIDNLSVREESGAKLVKKIADREAALVCDPTLLLNQEEWMEIQDSKPIIEDDYIFCYFLGKNIVHRKFVEKLKKLTGYKIVSINHIDEYVKYSDIYADVIPYDAGPKEFVNYIKNAKIVCTDSFHGTMFSLINNINFFAFNRFKESEQMSTNSRIETLLNVLDIKDRLIEGTEDLDKLMSNKINFDVVNKKLEQYRTYSRKWLIDSIKWNPNN